MTPETKFGLPAEVRFCARCVISNQRPSSTVEYTHTRESKKETIHVDADGVCAACRFAEMKEKVDWAERERELQDLLARHRRTDGRYDVLVPGSGGKLHIVQFRGLGSVAFRSARPLLAIKLALEKVLYVDATALAGWIGRVVPRVVSPVGGGQSELFVECSGEGVVLIEEEQTSIGIGAAVAGESLEAVTAGPDPSAAGADPS